MSLELLINRLLYFLQKSFATRNTWFLFKDAPSQRLKLYSLKEGKIIGRLLPLPDKRNWFYLSLFEAAHSLLLLEKELSQLQTHIFWTKAPAKSLYAVPLFRGVQVSGAILLGEAQEPSLEKLNTLQIMSGQISVSLERVQMYIELEDNYLATIKALASAIEAKDRYTKGHSERVTLLALALGELMGLTKSELKELKYGGLLHDIGKIGIPERILNKPAYLTDKELAEIKKHPLIGDEIISSVPFLREVTPYVRSHHERYDGQGYPDGIKTSQLGLGVRILSVCDAFDAMSTNRPYHNALSFEDCQKDLLFQAGRQFDSEVVHALIQLFSEHPEYYPQNKSK